ncbi:unnamed protein product [Amoebophrya sp. A25]|nr:unnamed protein product [Amoebophrya sp. A25]|eukprot:GSA25T00016104001.1
MPQKRIVFCYSLIRFDRFSDAWETELMSVAHEMDTRARSLELYSRLRCFPESESSTASDRSASQQFSSRRREEQKFFSERVRWVRELSAWWLDVREKEREAAACRLANRTRALASLGTHAQMAFSTTLRASAAWIMFCHSRHDKTALPLPDNIKDTACVETYSDGTFVDVGFLDEFRGLLRAISAFDLGDRTMQLRDPGGAAKKYDHSDQSGRSIANLFRDFCWSLEVSRRANLVREEEEHSGVTKFDVFVDNTNSVQKAEAGGGAVESSQRKVQYARRIADLRGAAFGVKKEGPTLPDAAAARSSEINGNKSARDGDSASPTATNRNQALEQKKAAARDEITAKRPSSPLPASAGEAVSHFLLGKMRIFDVTSLSNRTLRDDIELFGLYQSVNLNQ